MFVLASAAAEAETGPVKDFVFFNRKSSPVIFNRNSSPIEAESANVSTMANVDNDALSSYDRRKEAVDTLPREVHSNSPPACAPTQQNVSTHHGRTHHSPFPTCQLRSLFFCIARSAAAAFHSAAFCGPATAGESRARQKWTVAPMKQIIHSGCHRDKRRDSRSRCRRDLRTHMRPCSEPDCHCMRSLRPRHRE